MAVPIILTLFLVGVIFLVANAVLVRQRRLNTRVNVLAGEEPKDTTVVYRYLPRDVDDYYRSDINVPSKLYSSMFTENDDALRIR